MSSNWLEGSSSDERHCSSGVSCQILRISFPKDESKRTLNLIGDENRNLRTISVRSKTHNRSTTQHYIPQKVWSTLTVPAQAIGSPSSQNVMQKLVKISKLFVAFHSALLFL